MELRQAEEHLRLLSIFHYVVGAMVGLFSCLPIFHFVFGIVALLVGVLGAAIPSEQPTWPVMLFPGIFGLLFIVIAGAFILLGWTFAICIIMAGRFLEQRRRYNFCLVVAGLVCMFMPLGTVLGVFTIIMLVKPEVRALFEERALSSG